MENKKINTMKIEVETMVEFEEWCSEGVDSDNKLMISKTIATNILDNLDKEEIYIFEVLVREENSVFDIKVVKEDFIFTLEKNLKILERFEEFELCSKVNKTINKLKNG